MRKKLGVVLLGSTVALVLITTTPGAYKTYASNLAPSHEREFRARSTASIASARKCSDRTVNQVGPAEETTIRFALIGHVSCDKAHHLISAYFNDVEKGRRCEGVQCIVQFRGGWTCSYFSAGESAEAGGALAGCYQSATRARVRVYGVLLGAGFVSPDRRVWCAAAFSPELGAFSEVGCVTAGLEEHRGAIVQRSSQVTLCAEEPPVPPAHIGVWDCFQNFDPKAPVLPYGERADVGGFRCTSATSGVTCTVVATGQGFLINGSEAVQTAIAGG